MKKYLSSSYKFIRRNYLYILGGLVLYGILFISAFHESYPDEYDNILGGWYILHGKIIYKDFFTHHGPMAYFLATPALIFSGNSFVKFRVVYSFMVFLMLVLPYLYLRASVGRILTKFYILLLFVIAFASVYFWGQMILADNLAAFFLMPPFALLVLKTLYSKKLSYKDVAFISFLTTAALLSSLTYLYITALIFLYTLFYFYKSNNLKPRNIIPLAKLVGLIILPGVLFLIYLLVTMSFGDYYYQNFTFNKSFYVYNYPRADGDMSINPIRYAIVIGNKFFQDATVLLIQVKDFNFNFPLNITLMLGNLTLFVYLLSKRKFSLAIFSFLVLMFSNVRTSPLTSKETDYQSAVYMLFSMFSVTLMLNLLYQDLKEKVETPLKIIFGVLFILLSTYSIFSAFYLLRVYNEKAYQKYMGLQPLIYDRPELAPFINSIVEDGETTWVGPFEFQELLYIKPEIASRYQIFNPGMGASGVIQDELISDIETNKPKVIWFDKRFHILGRSPEDFGQKFISSLEKNYSPLYIDNVKGEAEYLVNYPIDKRFDIATMLYIRNENREEIIKRLLDKGYIKESSQE